MKMEGYEFGITALRDALGCRRKSSALVVAHALVSATPARGARFRCPPPMAGATEDWTTTRPFAETGSVFAHAAPVDAEAYTAAAPRAVPSPRAAAGKRKRAGGGSGRSPSKRGGGADSALLPKAVRARLERVRALLEESGGATQSSQGGAAAAAEAAVEVLRAASEGMLDGRGAAAMSSNLQLERASEALLYCSRADALKVDDAALLHLAEQLLGNGGGGEAAMGLHHCRIVVRRALLPRVRALERPATRVFFQALLAAAAASPQAVVDGLLQPLMCEEPLRGAEAACPPETRLNVGVGSSQAEVAKRLVKDALPAALLAPTLRALLRGGAARAWTDVSLPVFHTALVALAASGGELPADVLALLVESCDAASQPGDGGALLLSDDSAQRQAAAKKKPLTASLKFSTLIFALVTKFGAQLSAAHVATLDGVLSRCTSMMTKAALKKLRALKRR